MIKIIDRITASALWDIDGAKVTLPYRKEYPEPVMAEEIKAFRGTLQTRAYEQDNSGLCRIFRILGGISFVAVAMTVPDDFLACFAYYAKCFAKEWAEGEKCLKAKFVGYEYVFQKMLQNEDIPIKYDFRYILDNVESEPFCEANEQAFAEQWIPTLLVLMEQGLSLADAAKRVGDVRISKYLMQIPTQTECYLKQLAGSYTAKRELISLTKVTSFILGSTSRTNFVGAATGFLELLSRIVDEEIAIQKVKFVADHRKEMSMSKDVWVLYQKHGTGLKQLTVDFSAVNQVSLRSELKHFLKNRFTYGFRASDRMFISLFDAINRLCKLNPQIRY